LIDEGSDLVAGVSGMGGMVKGKGGEWEERTDGVMQVLRTICLQCTWHISRSDLFLTEILDGAALFYTTPLPTTLQVLRQYTLHLLFTPPAPSLGLSSGTDTAAPTRNPFPFQHKSNTLDRDRIVVPAGWDSWGKITVMRDGFEAKIWGEAWDRDLETDCGDANNEIGAKKLFSALVPDQGIKVSLLPTLSTEVNITSV
jgi:dynein light intermediate chain 1